MPGSSQIRVSAPRDSTEADLLMDRIRSTWGDGVARRGELVDPAGDVVLGAYENDTLVGVASYQVDGDRCEVVTIEAFERGRGIGTALMDEIARRATSAGCGVLWLVTTNDNLPAIGFYQRWGMDLTALRRGSMTEARLHLKPEIPQTGYRGIPIRHVLEFELSLTE